MLLRYLWRSLVELVYPRLCALCSCRLVGHEQGVCMVCARGVPLYNAVCHKAHERLYASKVFGELYAVLSYRKGMPSQHLIHAFKYRGHAELSELFSRMLEAMYPELLLQEYDCIVPVPITSERLVERGYNQAALLARRLGRRGGVEVLAEGAMRVDGRGQSQTLRGKLERHVGISNAFELTPQCATGLCGKRVLLVDDVLTTGATMLALLSLLEEAGVARVDVCVVAVALLDR